MACGAGNSHVVRPAESVWKGHCGCHSLRLPILTSPVDAALCIWSEDTRQGLSPSEFSGPLGGPNPWEGCEWPRPSQVSRAVGCCCFVLGREEMPKGVWGSPGKWQALVEITCQGRPLCVQEAVQTVSSTEQGGRVPGHSEAHPVLPVSTGRNGAT